MPLTTEQTQELILLRVGDVTVEGNPTRDGTGVAKQQIALLWEYHAGAATAKLRELYVERDALRLVIAVLTQFYDTTSAGGPVGGTGNVEKRSQWVEHRLKQLALVEAQIARCGGITVLTLTTSPYTVEDCIADALVAQIA